MESLLIIRDSRNVSSVLELVNSKLAPLNLHAVQAKKLFGKIVIGLDFHSGDFDLDEDQNSVNIKRFEELMSFAKSTKFIEIPEADGSDRIGTEYFFKTLGIDFPDACGHDVRVFLADLFGSSK